MKNCKNVQQKKTHATMSLAPICAQTSYNLSINNAKSYLKSFVSTSFLVRFNIGGFSWFKLMLGYTRNIHDHTHTHSIQRHRNPI